MTADDRHHERYDELAVGHVLGGLDEESAADFRSHLLGCRDCRLRVAELRDLASDLAAAEREEKAQLRVQTEVVQRTEPPHEPEDRWRPLKLSAAVAGVVVVLVGIPILLFWNFHLRTVNDELLATAEVREEVLRELAEGTALDADIRDGVTGVVVVDEEDVTITVAGLPDLADGEAVVVWLGPDATRRIYRETPGGLLAATFDKGDADQLILSVEDGQELGDRPSDRVLLTASLSD